MKLGSKFKRYRLKAGLKQNEAAKLIGVNNYQLGNYETNRSEPSIDVLKKMSHVYGVSVDALIGNDVPKKKNITPIDDVPFDLDDIVEKLNEIVDEINNAKK